MENMQIGGAFLPEQNAAPPPTPAEPRGIYPCPCCGMRTYPVPPEDDLSYICPVCYWENDRFIATADEPSDQNHGMTLSEAQKAYAAIGAVRADFLKYVRKPTASELPEEK